ncbi:MAG: DUF2071 domain-containing protein [Pirellulaceae bacterium]
MTHLQPSASATPAPRVFLSARWQALAMLNYEIDPGILRPLVPCGTELDTHDGKTYVSLVGFLFLRTRVLGLAIPFHANFEEVNLRFYVRREVGGELRRGVVFIKEIVPRWAIARTARLAYNEPYLALPMSHHVAGPVRLHVVQSAGWIPREDSTAAGSQGVEYRWRFQGRWNSLALRHEGRPAQLVAGSHAEFIAEHYWGYCGQRDGSTVEYQVQHPPWQVWRGLEPRLDCDAGALYGPQFAPVLGHPPATAFLADGSAIAVLRPTRIA